MKEKSEVVEVEIWYSSNNQRSLDFIKEFKHYAEKLIADGVVNIEPR